MPLRLWVISTFGPGLFIVPFVGLDPGGDAGYVPLLGTSIAAILVLLLVEATSRRIDSRRFALLAAIAAIDAALRDESRQRDRRLQPGVLPDPMFGVCLRPLVASWWGRSRCWCRPSRPGGVGPWLPYEMFAAGWVGAIAGIAGSRRSGLPARRDLAVLAATGVILGFLYGAATDVYDWGTFYRGSPGLGWVTGMGPGQAVSRFFKFYLATSVGWDSLRAAGNALMVAFLGAPVLAAMVRFRSRFSLVVEPLEPAARAAGPAPADA